jgi:hypothetical protein
MTISKIFFILGMLCFSALAITFIGCAPKEYCRTKGIPFIYTETTCSKF